MEPLGSISFAPRPPLRPFWSAISLRRLCSPASRRSLSASIRSTSACPPAPPPATPSPCKSRSAASPRAPASPSLSSSALGHKAGSPCPTCANPHAIRYPLPDVSRPAASVPARTLFRRRRQSRRPSHPPARARRRRCRPYAELHLRRDRHPHLLQPRPPARPRLLRCPRRQIPSSPLCRRPPSSRRRCHARKGNLLLGGRQ